MATTIYLLPHQERFIQSPECFPEIRWHFLLGGYGAGKTISLVQATLYYISRLQGVRDDAGKYTRLMVGGYTYAHLEQTYMIDLMSYLDQSKTVYRNDTKNHIMYIGTVQIIFVQLSEPDRIFGQSTYCALLDEIDELPEDTMIEAMKSVSQRCRRRAHQKRHSKSGRVSSFRRRVSSRAKRSGVE